ncbi:MAG: ABC transporter permease [Nitrososphaerales archaeon]|nr:ABC transporter permease [Nitrososphaerales archaeon]
MRLYQYVLRRLIFAVFVLLACSVIVFWLLRGPLPPESVLAAYITPKMNDPEKLQLAQTLGVATSSCPSYSALSQHVAGCVVPLWQQYFGWLSNALSGNWGYSFLPGISGTGETTWEVFAGRFPYTAELALVGSILTILIALPLGVISATHNNSIPDHTSRLFALLGYSVPLFVLGYVYQLFFGLYLTVPHGGFAVGLLPVEGQVGTTCAICFANPGQVTAYTGAPLFDAILSGNPAYFWDALVAVFLPAFTLATGTIAALTRVLRSSMLEVLRQDYILLARSKGLSDRVVIYRHALRNALLPAVTIAGLIVATLFGGVVLIEIVFSWPGIGAAAVQASLSFDTGFLELYTLATVGIIVLANLSVDLIYAKLDPRIRY